VISLINFTRIPGCFCRCSEGINFLMECPNAVSLAEHEPPLSQIWSSVGPIMVGGPV
jgi:hypothetical protein